MLYVRGLFLCSIVVMFHNYWCIRKPESSIMLCNNNIMQIAIILILTHLSTSLHLQYRYKIIKQGGRPEDVRRVLLAKWLYVHGFITQHAFPPAPGEVFLPRNLIETDEEDGFSDFSSNAEY